MVGCDEDVFCWGEELALCWLTWRKEFLWLSRQILKRLSSKTGLLTNLRTQFIKFIKKDSTRENLFEWISLVSTQNFSTSNSCCSLSLSADFICYLNLFEKCWQIMIYTDYFLTLTIKFLFLLYFLN